uniref:Uncharacterized protein n=1 Tax=Kalanchoe fedtschenkoi TaxID=63787 RepID=A0A7N0U5S6_KALFE
MCQLVHLCSLVTLGAASSAGRLSCTFRASSAGGRQKMEKVRDPNKQSNRVNKNKNVLGFGTEKKAEKWSCVQGCGACCKLDKGPSFGTPEEIFDDPVDVEVVPTSVVWRNKFSRTCTELTRRGLTKKHAVRESPHSSNDRHTRDWNLK